MYKSKKKMVDYARQEFKKNLIKNNLVKIKSYFVFIGIFNFLGGRPIDTCIFPFLPTHFSFFWPSYALLEISLGSFDR
jgi:hypothetical protein